MQTVYTLPVEPSTVNTSSYLPAKRDLEKFRPRSPLRCEDGHRVQTVTNIYSGLSAHRSWVGLRSMRYKRCSKARLMRILFVLSGQQGGVGRNSWICLFSNESFSLKGPLQVLPQICIDWAISSLAIIGTSRPIRSKAFLLWMILLVPAWLGVGLPLISWSS